MYTHESYVDMNLQDWYLDRRQYAGLCSLWDEILGNVTSALKARQMWASTLLAFASDNGGPVYWSVEPSFPHGAGANNWPLLGGSNPIGPDTVSHGSKTGSAVPTRTGRGGFQCRAFSRPTTADWEARKGGLLSGGGEEGQGMGHGSPAS